MSPSRAARSKFAGPEPILHRPEERIAAATMPPLAASGARPRPAGLTVAILLFALIGLGIAAYTTAVHYIGPSALICTAARGGSSPCEQVQFSQWNNLAGIPVAVLGLAGYLVILLSLAWRTELGRGLGFGTALIGFLFSLYLTYREAFSIHHYCEWCLGSAACMTLLTILLGVRFLRTPPALR